MRGSNVEAYMLPCCIWYPTWPHLQSLQVQNVIVRSQTDRVMVVWGGRARWCPITMS